MTLVLSDMQVRPLQPPSLQLPLPLRRTHARTCARLLFGEDMFFLAKGSRDWLLS